MKKLKTSALAICLIYLTGCGSNRYERYVDKDDGFYPFKPDVYIYVEKEKRTYFKIIHFNQDRDMTFQGDDFLNFRIEEGYHLGQNLGYVQYDFKHTYTSLDKAIDAVKNTGTLYLHPLGEEYQYHDGSLYKNNPFVKLKKD